MAEEKKKETLSQKKKTKEKSPIAKKPVDKKGNEEPFVAPSAWLSVYDGKNTDSS